MAGIPSAVSVGNVIRVPPPARAFTAPAARPAIPARTICIALIMFRAHDTPRHPWGTMAPRTIYEHEPACEVREGEVDPSRLSGRARPAALDGTGPGPGHELGRSRGPRHDPERHRDPSRGCL